MKLNVMTYVDMNSFRIQTIITLIMRCMP